MRIASQRTLKDRAQSPRFRGLTRAAWEAFPLATCRTSFVCCLCQSDIEYGQWFYRAVNNRAAHASCVERLKK